MRDPIELTGMTKLENLNFDHVEDGWINFRKIICEVSDGVLGRKLGTQLGILVKKVYV